MRACARVRNCLPKREAFVLRRFALRLGRLGKLTQLVLLLFSPVREESNLSTSQPELCFEINQKPLLARHINCGSHKIIFCDNSVWAS